MGSQPQNLKISVERLLEQEVDQISRSGEETYVKPFTLSEELAYFASKIDFHGTEDPLQGENSTKKEGGDDNNEKRKEVNSDSAKDESRWSWETVHGKLRIALSEICVMLDVLECLNRKKYLVLDPIQQNPEQNKQTVQMLQNRKYLARAGSIIAKGANSLNKKKPLESTSMIQEIDDEYYMELMQLRQYWRIKKSGTQITGDITYRSAGSQFWHPGLIEVKAALGQNDVGVDQRKLVVNISPDLMQFSTLTVEIIDSNFCRPWSAKTKFIPWKKSKTAFEWENDLQLAQLHLFNLEVFSLLSNDAFQGSYDAIEVLDSRICCRILDGVEVIITHHVGEKVNLEDPFPEESSDDLTLFLSTLLLHHHSNNIKSPSLYPATSNHCNKLVKSSSIHNLLNRKTVSQQSSVLKEFIEEAKHKIWVTRLMYFLDEKSKYLNGTSLVMHWNSIKCRLLSSVTLLILTKMHATSVTSNILLTVDTKGFAVTFENADKVSLPFDMEVLGELVDLELKNHFLKVGNSLCIQHGWFLVQTSPKYTVATGAYGESIENGSIYYSRKHRLFLRLHIRNINDIAVGISSSVKDLSYLDEKFKWLNIQYKSLSWNNLPGRTFTEKIENLFLCN